MMVRFFQYCSVALCILFLLGCSNNTSQNEKISSPELQTEGMTNDSTSPPDSQDGNTNDNTPDQENHPSISEDTARQLQEIPDIQPYTFTYNEQEFEIIPLYSELLEYITLAREAKIDDWDAIYQETVEDAFQRSAWGYVKAALPVNPKNDVFTPSYRLDQLEESVHTLIDKMEYINKLIEEALKKSADLLPNSKTKVYVIPSNPENYVVMEMIQGVTGLAYDTQVFIIQIEPKVFKESALQFIVAHEYHHTAYFARLYKNYSSYNFLESILIEGKADTFATMVYPDINPPLGKAPLENEEHVWSVMKKVMDPESTLHINFSFGNRAMDIPPLSDYSIGYQIMQDFLKNNPEVSIEEWTEMKAADILELSRFEERFED